MAAMIVCASSKSICRETEKPNRLRFSCRWIIVIILDPRDFSIARIACIRFVADQRPIRSGCRLTSTKKMSSRVEKSIDTRSHSVLFKIEHTCFRASSCVSHIPLYSANARAANRARASSMPGGNHCANTSLLMPAGHFGPSLATHPLTSPFALPACRLGGMRFALPSRRPHPLFVPVARVGGHGRGAGLYQVLLGSSLTFFSGFP